MADRKKWTSAEREAVYQKTGGRCAYCGQEITRQEMQLDHVKPVKLYEELDGGAGLNDLENILPACRSCNHYKHTFTLEKFRAALERMPAVLERDSVTYRNAVRFGLVQPTPHKVRFYFETMKAGDGT
ncbi:HNH endonuclease [uncultured Dysosmobacter sp.]|uniref:HNH endonuclease n=1 Tax=uncultured Dysosmobacter sp. TaxID=2591384 RepID=UPI00262C5413|nr:HNH endonuclease signature motif containing protein [uncultured Dysosmobacter sp.]